MDKSFILIFILLIVFLYFLIKKNSKMEYFENRDDQSLKIILQVDDSFKLYYNDTLYVEGVNWDRSHEVIIPDAEEDTRIVIDATNTGGVGGICAKFYWDGKEICSNTDVLICAGQKIDNNTIISNKRVGCTSSTQIHIANNFKKFDNNISDCLEYAKNYGYEYAAIDRNNVCYAYNTSPILVKDCQASYNDHVVYSTRHNIEKLQTLANNAINIWNNIDGRLRDCNWVWVGDDNGDHAVGTFRWYFIIPRRSKTPRCTNPLASNFTIDTCKNISSNEKCIDTINRKYYSNDTLCNKTLDYDDLDMFIYLNSKLIRFLSSYSDIRLIDNGSSDLFDKHTHQNYNEFIGNYITDICSLIELLTYLAHKTDYPIDVVNTTDNGNILPSCPQFSYLLQQSLNNTSEIDTNMTHTNNIYKTIKDTYKRLFIIVYKLNLIIGI